MAAKWATRVCVGVLVFLMVALFIFALVIIFHPHFEDDDDDDDVSSTTTQRTATSTTAGTTDGTLPYDESPYGEFRYAAVADDAGPCAKIGTDVLARLGGTAVDAAIAAMLCVGVLNPHSAGIGGGFFMTVYDTPQGGSEREVRAILAREKAPLAAEEDMFVNSSPASVLGGLSVGIPGEIKGYHHAWTRFGRVPWRHLVEPSVRLCREGHRINSALAFAMGEREEVIRNQTYLRELFVKEDGSLYEEGDILRRPKLADTLAIIANDPLAFYRNDSQLARDVAADIQEAGGIITLEDLQNYEVYDKPALNVTLKSKGYTLHNPPPPSSGVILSHILGIIDGYNFTSDSIATLDKSILTHHRIVEAFKFAYGKRSALGDEEFVDVAGLLANLTSEDFADHVRMRISDEETRNYTYYEPAFVSTEDGGTAQLSVLAPDGSAVSMTSTINLYFGSKVRGNRTGIIFNNEMDDFSTPGLRNAFGFSPSPSNFIEPGKMPMSSMCPTIMLDSEGNARMLSGASGGSRIISSTAQVLINNLWLGLPLGEATTARRLHHQLLPDSLFYEPHFDMDVIRGLAEKGHDVVSSTGASNVQTIRNDCENTADPRDREPCIVAASDGRKSGFPDGF